MESFIFSLNATIPVFSIIIVGNLLKRLGIIDSAFSNTAEKFVFKVCLPCLLFQDLTGTDIRNNFDLSYVSFCFLSTLASIIIIWIVGKKIIRDKSIVGAFVQGSYRSSAAILGVAFIQNIYGTSGMAPIMIIASVPLYNIFAVIILTIESNEKSKDSTVKRAVAGIIKNPIIIGIAAGLTASYLNIELPRMIDKSISNLAVMASSLALISLGASFEGKKALAKIKPTAAASMIKLIILAAVFLPVAVYLGFRDQKLIAIVIMFASPCTPTAYIMAKNMHGDETLAGSIVVATTFFSAITMTGWIYLMKSLALIR
ncbi:MAG: AEC family transporter [Lachnospiraceae bacterium]|nr:AEC family transporter [Lachnospiraceae bacterium]